METKLSKAQVLKQINKKTFPEIKAMFTNTKRSHVISQDFEDRLTTLVDSITQGLARPYSLADDGFSGCKYQNSLTFYLGNLDIEVIFSNRGKVKDFSIDKTSCDMTGLF